jgi:hypothetical protein
MLRNFTNRWNQDYKRHRLHSSLGDLAPIEFAAICIPSISFTAQLKECSKAV